MRSTRTTCQWGLLAWTCLTLASSVRAHTPLAASQHRRKKSYGNSVNIGSSHHHENRQRDLLTTINLIAPYVEEVTEEDLHQFKVSQKPQGDASCPCLTAAQLEQIPREKNAKTDAYFLGGEFDFSFGLGCEPHDQDVAISCVNIDSCVTEIPLPENCDRSWCYRSFCYVDPENCDANYAPSTFWKSLYYSYATCGHMDSFTAVDRVKALQNQTYKVAINSNTGGWMGAYNVDGHFSMNGKWDGPLVHFIRDAAIKGGFKLDMQAPPEWLKNESLDFFGSSSFDYCVYATSLGYLDFCVGAYTITSKRASVAPFFELTNDPIYLITFTGGGDESSWEDFAAQLTTIFQPFTYGSWIMIICFCLPTLGVLMLFHEYHTPGGAFPREQEIAVMNTKTMETNMVAKPIPLSTHVSKAVYFAFLSLVSGTYDTAVITTGGKMHLLAILTFLVFVLAVYTANLAAILTTVKNKSEVKNLDEAILQGYNFCAEKKIASLVMNLFPIQPDSFVPDPIELGGDGGPGFGCPDCQARDRVFDFMKKHHTNRSLYCDAAFIAYEDLQVHQNYANHCNKTVVGDVLALATKGIPIKESISAEMQAFLYQMKYEGTLAKHLQEAAPVNQCPIVDNEGDGIGLSPEQLTGIWVLVFFMAFIALVLKAIGSCRIKKNGTFAIDTEAERHKVLRFDQWGNPIDNPHAEVIVEVNKRSTFERSVLVRQSTMDRESQIEKMAMYEMQSKESTASADEFHEEEYEEEITIPGSTHTPNAWWTADPNQIDPRSLKPTAYYPEDEKSFH